MIKRWQELQKQFANALQNNVEYTVYNCGEKQLSGVYKGYDKGCYLFECTDGLYKVNLHKMKDPEVIIDIPLF